jgi:hypothetical protein
VVSVCWSAWYHRRRYHCRLAKYVLLVARPSSPPSFRLTSTTHGKRRQAPRAKKSQSGARVLQAPFAITFLLARGVCRGTGKAFFVVWWPEALGRQVGKTRKRNFFKPSCAVLGDP